MKKIFAGILSATALWQASGANSVWLTDLPQAEVQAKARNQLVLVDFTGSDWCPACILLKKKVFDTKNFRTYAATNFVLVELDYPQNHAQADALKKANKDLLAKFNSDEDYPLLVLVDSTGKEIGRHRGYDNESPQAFIQLLEKLKTGK